MLITTAKPREIIEWFEEVDRAHEILCCLIIADPKHRQILEGLIKDFACTDNALGGRVGFLVFGGPAVENYVALKRVQSGTIYLPGHIINFPASAAVKHVYRMREFLEWRGPEQWDGSESNVWTAGEDFGKRSYSRESALQELTEASVYLAEDWIHALEIQRSDLPALGVLVKHAEPLVLKLGAEIDLPGTRLWLKRLVEIADRPEEPIPSASLIKGNYSYPQAWEEEAARRVRIANELEEKIRNAKLKLIRQLDALAVDITADDTDRVRIAQFVDAGAFRVGLFEDLISSLPIDKVQDGQRRNHAVANLRRTVQTLDSLIIAYNGNLPDDSERRSIAELVESLKHRRKQTADLVAELAKEGKGQRVPVAHLASIAETVTTKTLPFLNLVEKAYKFFEWLSGMPKHH